MKLFRLFSKKKERKYYSQKGQDKWVIEEIFKGKRNGFFLDLAASNGVEDNNTYVLEKRFGWKGICIEPNKSFFKELIKNRNCICNNSCIDGKKHKVKFFEIGQLGGIIDKDTDNNYKTRKKYLDKLKNKIVEKETTTLKEILEKYNAPKVIGFFSFDVEGAETRILKNFPFKEYIFLTIAVERPSKELHKLLLKNNYIFVRKSNILNDEDSFYIHKTLKKIV